MTYGPQAVEVLFAQVMEAIRAQVLTEEQQKQKYKGAGKRLLTVAEAAEYLGRSEQAVRHLIHQRKIPVIRQGRNVRIDIRDLDLFIEEHRC